MPANSANAKSEHDGPDRMLLEALIKDSEEEWMKIIKERKDEIVALPVCFLVCTLKRWTTTLNMLANFQRPLFKRVFYWKKSVLYQYIRNDAVVANAEKWPRLSFFSLALFIAARDGYTEGVKALLKFGVLPNVMDQFGGPPLLDAVLSRNIETVRAFLDAGAKDYYVKCYDITAAAKAAQLGELEIMQEIGWNANDDSVLECGVHGGSIKVIQAIIAVRTEKFDLKRASRFATDESLCKLLSEANATLPEKVANNTGSRWRSFFAKPKQPKTVPKKSE